MNNEINIGSKKTKFSDIINYENIFNNENNVSKKDSKSKKDRNAINDIFDGSLKNFETKLNQKDIMDRDYNRLDIDEVFSNFDPDIANKERSIDLYDEAINEIKPTLTKAALKLDKLSSKSFNAIKRRKHVKKLKDDINSSFQSNSGVSEYELKKDASEFVDKRINEAVENKRFIKNYNVLSNISQQTKNLFDLNNNIFTKFHKKSLELQYRSYFVQSEILSNFKKYISISLNQNEAIVKNTSLPDVVKTRTYEAVKQQLLFKTINSFQESLFKGSNTGSLVGGKLNKFIKSISKNYLTNSTIPVRTTAIENENVSNEELMARQINPTLSAIGGVEGAGKLAGKYLNSNFKKYSRIIDRKIYEATERAHDNSLLNKISNLSGGPFNVLNMAGGMGKFTKDSLKSISRNGISPNIEIASSSGFYDLKSKHELNKKDHKSLTEIIPGYLSRILKELNMARTGVVDNNVIQYDFKKGKFVEKKELGKDLKTNIRRTVKNTGISNAVEEEYTNLFNSLGVTDPKQRGLLKKTLMQLSRESNIDNLKYEDLLNTDAFKSLKRKNKSLSNKFKKRLETLTSTDRHRSYFKTSLLELRRVNPDISQEIDNLIEAGYRDSLIEEGIIEIGEHGEYNVNIEKYNKIIDDTVATSDKNAKKNIRDYFGKFAKSDINLKNSISDFKQKGKNALKGVVNTKVYNWKYKDKNKDNKDHIGPMAQDVNKNIGEKAAPGGVKLDLINMNGVNMAAIQNLYEKVKDMPFNNDSVKEVLDKIGQNTKLTSELLLNKENINDKVKEQKYKFDKKIKQKKEQISDVYSELKEDPILFANKLKNNEYINKKTGKVIKTLKDITGDVVDKSGNIVATHKELSSRLINSSGSILNKNLFNNTLFKIGTKLLSPTLDRITKTKKDKHIETLLKTKNELLDEEDRLMKNGNYNQDDLNTLRNKISIIESELWKLNEGTNRDLKNTATKKIIKLISSPFKHTAKNAGREIKWIGKGVKSVTTLPFKIAAYPLKLAKKVILSNITKSKKTKNDKQIETLLKTKNELLKELDLLLENENYSQDDVNILKNKIMTIKGELRKLIDNNNLLEEQSKNGNFNNKEIFNSKSKWKEKLKTEEEDEKTRSKNKFKKADLAARYSKGGLVDTLTNLFGKFFGKLTDLFSIFKGSSFVKKALSLGGSFLGKTGLRTAGAAAVSGLSGISLASTGAAIGTGLGAVAGVVTSPIVVGGTVLAGIGYLGYKAYKYVKGKVTPLMKYRFYQYGFTEESDHLDHFKEVQDLERYLIYKNAFTINGNEIKIDDTKFTMGELYKMFSIDEKDKTAVESFLNWFNLRFKPFFLKHIYVCYNLINSYDLFKLEKCSNTEIIKYISETKYASGPYYENKYSPFPEIKLSNNATGFLKYTDSLINDYKVKKEKEESNLGSVNPGKLYKQVKEDKSFKKEIKEDDYYKNKEFISRIKKQEYNNTLPTEPISEDGNYKNTYSTVSTSNADNNSSNVSVSNQDIKIPTAKGPIADGSGAMKYVKFNKGTDEGKLQHLHPKFLKVLLGAIEEYGNKTGKSVLITSSYRSTEDQERLYKTSKPGMAAKPGNSLHEFGLAVDINSADADGMEKAGVMKKYGLTRPVGKETWHVESAGIQNRLNDVKRDPELASQLIEFGIGHGGGGNGLTKNKGRNVALAQKLFNDAKETPVEEINEVINKINTDSSPVNPLEEVSQTASTSVIDVPKSFSPDEKSFLGSVSSSKSSSNEMLDSKGSYAGSLENNKPLIKDPFDTEAEVKTTDNSSSNVSRKPVKGKEGILKVIDEAAKKVGLPPVTLQQFAAIESDLNPNAHAPGGSAVGLMQFLPGTWKESLGKWGKKYGFNSSTPRTDPMASALLGGEYLKQNLNSIKSLVSNPTTVDGYLTHLLGAGGARKMLRAGNSAIAANIDSKAARNNKSLFYAKGGTPRTVGQLKEEIARRINEKSKKYGISGSPLDTGGLSSDIEGSVSNLGEKTISSSNTTNAYSTSSTTSSDIGSSPASSLFNGVDVSKFIPSTVPESVSSSATSINQKPSVKEAIQTNDNVLYDKSNIVPFSQQPQSSEPKEQVSNSSLSNIDKVTTTISSTLIQSLEVQKQILNILKDHKTNKQQTETTTSNKENIPQQAVINKSQEKPKMPKPAMNITRSSGI